MRLVVTKNTAAKRDGTLRVWINDQPVVARTDIEWRSVETFGVDGLHFKTFHGGGDAS